MVYITVDENPGSNYQKKKGKNISEKPSPLTKKSTKEETKPVNEFGQKRNFTVAFQAQPKSLWYDTVHVAKECELLNLQSSVNGA